MAWKFKDLLSRKAEVVEPDAPAWFDRGNGHASQRQWQPALDCYREAVRADPNHAAAHAFIGNVLRQLGEPEAALVAYERAIAVKPDFAEAHYNRAAVLHQARRPAAALAGFDAALAVNPSLTEAHCGRGDVLRELGRPEEALGAYDAAIAANGGYSKAYLQRGSLQQQLRRPEAAEADYRRALALRPGDADILFALGTLQHDAGDTVAALSSFDAAIAAQPGHAGAQVGRGLASMAQGRPEAAIACFDAAIQGRPDFARAYGCRAQALAGIGRLAAARASHDQAVLLDPQDAALLFNRGAFLGDQREWAAAIEAYRAAIAVQPDHAEAHCNLGLAWQETGRIDAALDSYSRALALKPAFATALNNRGNIFRSRRQFDAALRDYRAALKWEPASSEAHYNLGQLALVQGDFAAGFPEYEWRRHIEEARPGSARQFPQPAWFGDAPLQGRRIFLHAEQGLGDTIQFCRYVPLFRQLGASVALEVQPPLVDLLANLDGVAQLTSTGDPVPAADYQCSVMSLPGAFRTTLETIPCAAPYLRADPDKVARWHERLGPRSRPRVGLAWSGNPRQSNDHNRSMPLARWIPHLPEGFDYVCLQNQIRDSDREALRTLSRIHTFEPQLVDFTDTAALMETLDLVISVDTSVAHLSGALGRDTWILLPFVPDWRWLLDRRDNPWYPTATLYRQPAAGDWEGLLAEVAQDLRSLPAARR